MTSIGTAYTSNALRVLLLGSGELGKELTISLQRLGVEVFACDNYEHAPAMQVAQHSFVFNMLDAHALTEIIETVQPSFIIPEVEAIATQALINAQDNGFTVVPCARATQITMQRAEIRKLAAEKLKLPTSNYFFAHSELEVRQQIEQLGFPCVIKPVMSSSGKGQMKITSAEELSLAWQHSQTQGRTGNSAVIVEQWLEYDYEITLLTIRHNAGTAFCAPIGHSQHDGDYQCSWQPHPMDASTLNKAQAYAKQITDELGGYGLFGVEFFIRGQDVVFSELSPRPHDTGLVTLISQNLSEFDLHARALLGLPIPEIILLGHSASHVITGSGKSTNLQYAQLAQALAQPNTDLRLFGKPSIDGKRRLGVALASANNLETAKRKAHDVAQQIKIIY